jgi:hypothetical protein
VSTRQASPPATAQPRIPGVGASPAALVPDEHGGPTSVRSFLVGYLCTLTVLLGGQALLLSGSSRAASTTWATDHPWPAAVAATTAWALGVAAWLHRRGWHAARLHAVSWAAPIAIVAPLTWLGWVSPAGLLLWAPLTTILAVALATSFAPNVNSSSGAPKPATAA